jgi:hypothetical protein
VKARGSLNLSPLADREVRGRTDLAGVEVLATK